jgi:IS5 family transposase
MFKVLLMEQWFNLSDPQAEAQINDRISFKIFLGMDITDTGPDETTICNFRNYIGSIGLADDLFEEINKQFEQKGLIVKTGTLIDASFYQASTKPPAKGKEPYCYGYKVHIGVDQDSGIARKTEITNARVNDHEVFDELISGDEKAVYADKAYYDKERAEELETKSIKNGLMKRGARGRPLSESDKARNKSLYKIRAQVERPFGIIKSKWGHNRARYLGLFRNKVHLLLIFIAYNMRLAYSLSIIVELIKHDRSVRKVLNHSAYIGWSHVNGNGYCLDLSRLATP